MKTNLFFHIKALIISLFISQNSNNLSHEVSRFSGGPCQTFENIRDNLYSVIALAELCQKLGVHFTYVGTGYIFTYDQKHPIGGKGFADDGILTKSVIVLWYKLHS